METLQIYFIELAKIFGHKYDDFFFDYLNSISKPNTSKCGKEILIGEGGWKCEDCELDSYSVYCNDCFIKEKHIGHKTHFELDGSGFCDCGDNSVIKPEGFCHKHKGDYTNMKELMNFIISSIPENLLSKINDILNKIFLLFIDKIKNISDNNENDDDEIYKMIDSLEIFCDKLWNNNLSLFYFVTLKLTENFPYETKHKCFYYDDNKKLITFIKKDNDKKHICICPFMQVMIYVLMRKNTRQNSSKFFNLFLQTYKNKIVTALCYLNSFSELFNNSNLNVFTKIGYQLVNEIGLLVYQEQNIPFLKDCFEEIYFVCDLYLKDKKYVKLVSIFHNFFDINCHLPSREIFDKINSNHQILKLIIDICCLPNNSNSIEKNNLLKSSIYEQCNLDLVKIELENLLSIICLLNILDFDNKETMNFIFNAIFEKLSEDKKCIEHSTQKIYSSHLINIKCYSLFLNRYCYNYSIKNNCDLLDSFNHFQKIFPQSKELNIFVFEELIKFFGFKIFQLHSLFVYSGFIIIKYHKFYFSDDFIFHNIDITLMKYLLTMPEIKEQFTLQKIISLLDMDSFNNFLNDLLSEKIDLNKINLENINEKNLKYINSVIEFLYLIIRDNLSMERTAFRKVEFKFKMKDEIYEKLYQKEKEKINNLVKNDIIHYILGNKNLTIRDDCVNYLVKIYDERYMDLLDKILKENCEKITLTNGLIQFSLKKEILKFCDIDNIITSDERKNASEYMTNFQSKDCNLLNIHIIEPLNITKKLTEKIYQTFYNEKNLNELIKFYNIIHNYNEKFSSLNKIFHFNISKILSFAYKLCSTQLIDIDFKVKINEKIEQIEDKEFLKYYNENTEKIIDSNIKKEKNNVKEKLKRKFTQKNEKIKEQIISSNVIIEEEIQKEGEECVYCRQSIHNDPNNSGYYGKICYYFSDYLTDICRKKEEDKRKKARKFVSCNHKMHFKCFNEFICLQLNNEFDCPLCKKLSNILLFDFSLLINNNANIIKGINYDKEKININDFYKENKDDKYEALFFSNILSFENYCSKLLHKQILIKDINNDFNLANEIIKSIDEDFEEFTIFYTMTNNEQEQINIWKNILYNLRLLYQYKILNLSDNILQLFNDILKIDTYTNLEKLLNNYSISTIINKFIITSVILLEANKENKERIKNIFHNNILLYIFYISYIYNNNNETFEEFLINNKIKSNKLFEFYKLKYKICLLLLNEKEENIHLNISLEEIISFIKSNSNFINPIKINKNKLLEQMKESNLDIPELNFIDIPENGIEFFQRTKEGCMYCQKNKLFSCFCLICGKKICNDIHCIFENSNGEKEYSLLYHSKKCCGGNGLFLDNTSSEIIYVLKKRIFYSKIFVYLNNFGENMKSNSLSEEYKLNKANFQKGIKQYIDLVYRKNSAKFSNFLV